MTIDQIIPISIKNHIEQKLNIGLSHIECFKGGTRGRTYSIGSEDRKWVLRVEASPQSRMRGIPFVQQRAQSVGMRVPTIIDHNVEVLDGVEFLWILEEFIEGTEFSTNDFDHRNLRSTVEDFGHQLRLLHTVEINGFGSLSEDLTNAKYTTWGEWIDEQEKYIEHEQVISRLEAPELAEINKIFQHLHHSYERTGRLCHGDFAADNLLVNDNQLVAAVDWENAIVCDPAHDVAYWCYWHENLASLLAGYEPDDASSFRRRILFHLILISLNFIVYYSEVNSVGGVEWALRVLRASLDDLG